MHRESEILALDQIDHVTLNVSDLDLAVNWYVTSFRCEVITQSKTHAALRFLNLKIVLTLPSQEQPHLAFSRSDAGNFGELRSQPDGGFATVVSDPSGNIVELISRS